MQRKALVSALLLVTVGVILGATVFRTDIAQATGLADKPSVVVVNTPAQAVPVREQNLDGGSIKIHEQGTANVNVTNTTVAVHEQGTVAVSSANDEVGFSRTYNSSTNGVCAGALYTVPSGKRLVVEYVSSSLFATGTPTRFEGSVGTVQPRALLFLPYQHADANTSYASEAVHFVFPEGSQLLFSSDVNGVSSCSAEVTLGGHLQPSP